MSDLLEQPEISVIVPVGARQAAAAEIHAEYVRSLDALGRRYEMIYVLDGMHEKFATDLNQLRLGGAIFTVISLTRPFGEATALMAGFAHARGQIVLTLPAYHQIQADQVATLLAGLDSADLVIGRRWPRAGGPLESLRRRAFHGLLASVTGLRFNDLGCGARALRRQILEEIRIYGDQHRFLALLADRQGFRVREVDVRQSPQDRFTGVYQPREYARGLLDIFSVFFLVRFTK